MIIFLYGPDEYRRLEKKRSIADEFRKKRSALGLGEFDLEGADALNALGEFLKNQSIFEQAKLALIEHAFAIEAKSLAAFLKPFADDKNITLLISEKDKPVKALAFLLERPTLSQTFDALAGAEWLTFVKVHAKEMAVPLAPEAIQLLAAVYEGDTWGLVTELEKLAGLRAEKAIGREDLAQFDLEAAPNYWALMNGLKSYDMRARLYALERMLALSDPPAKIFNILAVQWKEKIPHMAEYDAAIKLGKVDYEEALVDLLVS